MEKGSNAGGEGQRVKEQRQVAVEEQQERQDEHAGRRKARGLSRGGKHTSWQVSLRQSAPVLRLFSLLPPFPPPIPNPPVLPHTDLDLDPARRGGTEVRVVPLGRLQPKCSRSPAAVSVCPFLSC